MPSDGRLRSCKDGFVGREEVVKRWDKVAEILHEVGPLERTIATHRAAIQQELGTLLQRPLSEILDLAQSLDEAEELMNRQDKLLENRKRLESVLAGARTQHADARLSLEYAESELER